MRQKKAAIQELEQIKYVSHGSAAFFPICMKVVSEYLEEDREVLQRAVSALGRGMERFYTKSLLAYDAWQEILLEEHDYTDIVGEELFARLLVQKDATLHLIEDRKQEARYLLELAAMQRERDSTQLERAARHLQKVSAYAEEILYLIGDWTDMDALLRRLADRKVREELAKLISYVKAEDVAALQCLKEYLR